MGVHGEGVNRHYYFRVVQSRFELCLDRDVVGKTIDQRAAVFATESQSQKANTAPDRSRRC